MQAEHQREMEALLENVRELSRELRLSMLTIDSFIPQEFQEMIEQYVHWNEDIGEWQLVSHHIVIIISVLAISWSARVAID